jgi:superfamily II RNA helicase
LGFVVMDEVHYLGDRFRGPVWEEVILGLDPSVRLVGLSATVSNVEEFGEWLDQVRGPVETIVSERRPVPLFQHVFAGHRLLDLFEGTAPTAQVGGPSGQVQVNPELIQLARQESRHLRDDSRRPRGRSGKGKRQVTYGSGAFGGASAGRFASHSRLVPRRADIVLDLDRQHLLPAIYFIFSRQGCDQAVRHLVADEVWLTTGSERRALLDLAADATAGLSADDLDALRYDDWREAFGRGIAAHHAGLLPVFKQAVEQAFTAGLVKVVFATETLALGINMPARTVVLDKLVKYNGQSHADITPGEYTQLTGRAGRRGIDVEGHAVVSWQPGLDPRALAGLAARRTYPLRSAFNPTANMVVNLVGSLGAARARALLELSFAQFQADRSRGLTRPARAEGGDPSTPSGEITPTPRAKAGSRGRPERRPVRSHALVDRFDRVCGVLEALGYLTTEDLGDAPTLFVTDAGRMLTRLYGEQDLVVAEAIRSHILEGLGEAQLAAVLSALVFESRARERSAPPRMPDRASDKALTELRRLTREVALVERDFKLDARPQLDIGFADAAYRWAQGATLGDILDRTDVTAGDFVRWIRQVVDLADQIRDADRLGPLAPVCRRLAATLRRGVVDISDPDD